LPHSGERGVYLGPGHVTQVSLHYCPDWCALPALGAVESELLPKEDALSRAKESHARLGRMLGEDDDPGEEGGR
jgi:hypothetical protein